MKNGAGESLLRLMLLFGQSDLVLAPNIRRDFLCSRYGATVAEASGAGVAVGTGVVGVKKSGLMTKP